MQPSWENPEVSASPFAPWLCRVVPLPDAAQEQEQQDEQQQGLARGERILCRQCLQLITSTAERIEIGGGHQHTFANPAGLLFQIGCFRRAQGCAAAGQPEAEWSWFQGYSWQVVLCSSCATHMGWLYTGSGDSFYGLILHRLLQGN
jgi:hypothetical protein